ncbi:hypothetical protein ACJQWK_02679 [Exserohilum turcicum]
MEFPLLKVPFDILFCIAAYLSLEDIVHLGATCKQLRVLLNERTVCRSVVQMEYAYTEEAKLAREEKITYRQALEAIYDRRNALSRAQPFEARVWGTGNAFVYRQGILCALKGHIVHVSDLSSQSCDFCLGLGNFVRQLLGPSFASSEDLYLGLLNYADGILSVYVFPEKSVSNGGYIFALNTRVECPSNERVVRVVQLASSSKLFVRNTADYLYYGTYTGRGTDGHHKWEIEGKSLNDKSEIPDGARKLLLDNFHGTDIGSTVAFEIHNDYFYAVSNQSTSEVEEIDYTSFYHVARFPVNSAFPSSLETNERLYRRQHKQGPIHDSWTDLTLQVDERTSETVIVESRREWVEASSRQSHDIYLPVMDSSNKPHWKPTPDLYSWSQHPEFSSDNPSPRSFVLTKTKFRAYNYGCMTFLDVVEDERCCNDTSRPPCLRLRVGSRREIGRSETPANLKGKAVVAQTKSNFVDSGTRYQHSPIRMWPPPASCCPCSRRLHDILNPVLPASDNFYTRSVMGVLDERRLVLMVEARRAYSPSDETTLGTIVVVDFGRSIESKDSIASVAGGPAPMKSSGRKIEEESRLVWKWQPGIGKLCRTGAC